MGTEGVTFFSPDCKGRETLFYFYFWSKGAWNSGVGYFFVILELGITPNGLGLGPFCITLSHLPALQKNIKEKV